MGAVKHQLALRQMVKKNLPVIVAVLLIAIGGFLVGVLSLQVILFLTVLLLGLLLAVLAVVSRRMRNVAVVLMLIVLPLTSILKAVTGSRFAPLVFDLGLLLACGAHLFDGLVQGKLRFGKLDALLLVLWGLAFVEMFNPNVPSMQAGIEGFRKFILMSIAFYIGRHLLQARDLRLFAKGMVLFSIPVTLYGIKQFFIMWPIDYRVISLSVSSQITFMMGGWIRPFSTMSGPFQLGSYLMILLLLILALLKGKRLRPSHRLLLVGLFILQIAALLMTRTKGNWGGFIAGVFVLFVLQSRNPIRAIVSLTGFALLAGAVISVVLSLTSGRSLIVLDDAFFAITHPLEAPTFLFRMDLWQESIIPAIQKQPFWGYGTSSAGEGLKNLYINTQSQFFQSHNLYIKVLLELGIVGLMLFLWIVGVSLWKGLRQLYRPSTLLDQDVIILLQWSVAVVIAFLVSGIVIPNLDAYPPNYYFWLLLGLLSRAKTLDIQS